MIKRPRDGQARAAFARRLLQLRSRLADEQGSGAMTQESFARLLGIRGERYRRWERAEMEPPLEILAVMRQRTGISLDWLIAGERPGSGLNPDQSVTFARRLQWTRELLTPNIAETATLMSVDASKWAQWETGEGEPPPIAKMVEFCQRYGVGLDFLYRGQLTGISPQIGQSLLERHPELRRETPDAAPTTVAGSDTGSQSDSDKPDVAATEPMALRRD